MNFLMAHMQSKTRTHETSCALLMPELKQPAAYEDFTYIKNDGYPLLENDLNAEGNLQTQETLTWRLLKFSIK